MKRLGIPRRSEAIAVFRDSNKRAFSASMARIICFYINIIVNERKQEKKEKKLRYLITFLT